MQNGVLHVDPNKSVMHSSSQITLLALAAASKSASAVLACIGANAAGGINSMPTAVD